MSSTAVAPRVTRSTGSWTYILALSLIGVLSLVTLALTINIVRRQTLSTELVANASRQRSFVQRMARVAEGVADGSIGRAAGNAEILDLANRIEHSENLITQGDVRLHVPPLVVPSMRRIYYDQPIALDAQVKSFLQHARAFGNNATANLADADLRAMVTADQYPLPSGLDTAINAFQVAADHDVRRLKHVIISLTGAMILVLILQGIFLYRPLFRRQRDTIAKLTESSTTDALTNVLNRSAFLQCIDRELARATRTGQPLCLLVADIDRFKLINDRFGEDAGDMVLQHFAAGAQLNLRAGDSLGRLGGEEFSLVLPATDLAGGVLAAERIRERFAGTSAAVVQGGQRVTATVSIGVLCTLGTSVIDVMEEADGLLVKAKANGRNRIEAGTLLRTGATSRQDSRPVQPANTAAPTE